MASRPGTIFIPLGAYVISSTLTYVGSTGSAFGIFGQLGSSFGGGFATTLMWNGSTGGTMMELRALQRAAIENIDIDGRLKAAICVWMHSNQANGGAGSDGNVFRRYSFLNVTGGANAVAFLVGEPGGPGYETDNCAWEYCWFAVNQQNESQFSAAAGWRAASGANAKNFTFYKCGFGGAQYGIDWQNGSGTLTVDSCAFENMGLITQPFNPPNNVAACIQVGTGNALIRACEVECYPDTAGVAGGARFVTSPGQGGAPNGGIVMESCAISITMPPDDGIVSYSGEMVLMNNYFSGGGGRPSNNQDAPKIYCGAPDIPSSGTGPVISMGNFWNIPQGGSAPYYQSGNLLTGPGSGVGAPANYAVWSFGDQSMSSQSAAIQLPPWFGVLPATGSTVWANTAWPSSVPAGGFATQSQATMSGGFNLPCNPGDIATVSCSPALPSGVLLSASVTAANTVTATWLNMSGAALSPPPAGFLRFMIWPKT
jgi:hypothetical protein